MRLVCSTRIRVPPEILFRLLRQLDALGFISPERRPEWCPQLGQQLEAGREQEVLIAQGRHVLTVRFRTVTLDPHRLIEDEFLSWPLRGGRRRLRLAAEGEYTRLTEENEWRPPWYLRPAVEARRDEQHALFQEKLDKTGALAEAIYAVEGDRAFLDGIVEAATAAGFVARRRDPPAPLQAC